VYKLCYGEKFEIKVGFIFNKLCDTTTVTSSVLIHSFYRYTITVLLLFQTVVNLKLLKTRSV